MKIFNRCVCCKNFCKAFKDFALHGNVLELAVGLIIGTAFTSVVNSLIEDIITPPFGLLLGGVDFSNLTIKMNNFIYTDQPPVVIRYGKFLEQIISLFFMALVLFFVIRFLNSLQDLVAKKRLEENRLNENISEEVKVLIEIRNILAKPTFVLEELIL